MSVRGRMNWGAPLVTVMVDAPFLSVCQDVHCDRQKPAKSVSHRPPTRRGSGREGHAR